MAAAKRRSWFSKLASGIVCEAIALLLERMEYMLHTVRNSKTLFGLNWIAASAKRSLIPSAFNLLAPILSMHYRMGFWARTWKQ